MSEQKKRGKKRRKTKYPGLKPSVNAKKRHEYIDFDYIDKLSHEEKVWLSNFNEEYMSGHVNHKEGDRIMQTHEEIKESYRRNNARNRCMLSLAKAKGTQAELGEFTYEQVKKFNSGCVSNDAETNLIRLIDLKLGLDDEDAEFSQEEKTKFDKSTKRGKKRK